MQLSEEIEQMYALELSLGGRAAKQYALLKEVKRKPMTVDGLACCVTYNPGRVRSVMADVSQAGLAARKCFLCPDGIEDKQQTLLWGAYYIRINPYPIFERHLTVSSVQHEPQRLEGHYADMLRLAAELPEYALFYNGPQCGASAPDHMHFQAVPIDALPLQRWSDEHLDATEAWSLQKIGVYCPSAWRMTSASAEEMEAQLWPLLEQHGKDVNVISWQKGGIYRSIVLFRKKWRPSCFDAANLEERIRFSPGTAEMAGIGVVSDEESFARMTAEKLQAIINEVSL